MKVESQQKLLTVRDVAAKLGVSRACVYQWISEHRLRVVDTDSRGRALVLDSDAVTPPPRKRGPRYKRDRPH